MLGRSGGMKEPTSFGRRGSLMSKMRSPALNQATSMSLPGCSIAGLWISWLVLCGPKRPPLSQKSL
jgi:hypothetical protein